MHRGAGALLAGVIAVGMTWLAGPALGAPAETYPLEKVRRGQTGYGLTTLQGVTPERFTFEVVGVVNNFLPKMDIILVKSADPKMQVTGFWQGMSGSPLYIEDKLTCAFSYGFRFNKVALGGCTPIEYMKREGFGTARRRTAVAQPGQQKGAPAIVTPQAASLAEWRRLVPSGNATETMAADRGGNWLLSSPRPAAPARPAAHDGEVMTASVPMAVAGFTAPAFAQVERLFAGYNLTPMRAGGGGRGEGGPTDFRMGGSIAVELVRGDMAAAATGTVSYVDGPKVLAFGHPMFQAGEFYAPVATAEVHTVVPSAMSAFVLASPRREIGALVQDRQSTIMADTGLRTPMIPLDIYIVAGSGKRSENMEFHVEILDNKWFSGPLAGMAAMNAVSYYLPDRDHTTAKVESTVKVKGAPAIRFVDYLYASDGASSVISGARGLRALVPLLMNPWVPVSLESVEVKVDLRFDANFGDIKEIRVPAPELAPGQRAWVDVVLDTYDGRQVVDRVPVDVPASLAGSIVQLEVTAGDAARVDAAPPVDFPSLLAYFRAMLPGNVYAATLNTSDDGVAIDGILVKDLPASALDKLSPSSSTQRSAGYKAMARTVSPAKRVVSGNATLLVRIGSR
jgi:hypothetical protein